MPRRVAIPMLALLMLAASGTTPCASATAQGKRPIHQHQDNKKTRREEIESLEQKWRQAQLNGDIPTMDNLLADDFLGTTANGQVVTKAQQLDRMRSREIDFSRFDLSDVKIKMLPSVAIVNSLAMVQGTMDGKPLNGSFRYTRVYQREPDGTWKITSFSATRIPGGQNAVEALTPPNPAGK